MLLRRLAASTPTRAVGTVTQSSALIGSASTSQSSTLEPPTAPSPGTYFWYLDSDASFHITPHSAHLSFYDFFLAIALFKPPIDPLFL
jgi:hypothetical protein